MAPSIPTRRPLLTATRVAMSVAAAACASSLYLAFGTAWAVTGLPTDVNTGASVCPVAQTAPAGVRTHAGAGDSRASVQ